MNENTNAYTPKGIEPAYTFISALRSPMIWKTDGLVATDIRSTYGIFESLIEQILRLENITRFYTLLPEAK